MEPKSISDLVNMDSPQAVLDEILFIMSMAALNMEPAGLIRAFQLTVDLYQGLWPEEQACNTDFHDLRHVTDTALAMMRLIHGAVLNHRSLSERAVYLGLIGALIHDAGYIQDQHDTSGTGAKYTHTHVQRSMRFIERYADRFDLKMHEVSDCQLIIQCTDLKVDIRSLCFPDAHVALMGKLLSVADLIGQMADRIYLEKLFYLFRELQEGQVGHYRDELHLLKHTLDFFTFAEKRIKDSLDDFDQLATDHFRARWNISDNLYGQAMASQKRHLAHILAHPEHHPGQFLRRKNIVRQSMNKKV